MTNKKKLSQSDDAVGDELMSPKEKTLQWQARHTDNSC